MTRNAMGRVLVVDDEEAVGKALSRCLEQAGFRVDVARKGAEAIEMLSQTAFDCIVSDVNMPQMNGIELLRAVRERDLDVPIILITGGPTERTAADAVSYGAYQYLTKPVPLATLARVTSKAARHGRMARLKRTAFQELGGLAGLAGDRAGLDTAFTRALETLWIAYQPIVRASDGAVFAHEALVRAAERALPHPGALLDAAERLGRLADLGRLIRDRAAEPMDRAPQGSLLFVNLHPKDLLDDALLSPTAPLSLIASRVVLEITERASLTEIDDVPDRVRRLRELGFRIAVDDLGAGYAGLTSFASLEPEIAKLDMSLIRDIDKQPRKYKIVESMTKLCTDMGVSVVAEGVETREERDALLTCGCDFLQGYFFAKPAKPFPTVTV